MNIIYLQKNNKYYIKCPKLIKIKKVLIKNLNIDYSEEEKDSTKL